MSLRKLLTTEHETFKAIYDAALKKDEKKLTEIAEQGILLEARYGYLSPMMLLASEGHVEAVELLINKYNGDINHAAFGFAVLGDTKRVNAYIKENPLYAQPLRDWAVKGYAFAGNHKEVNALIVALADRNGAIKGYAAAGLKEDVKRLCQTVTPHKKSSALDRAVFGFAVGGFEDYVNELIVEGATRKCALDGYTVNGHIQLADKLLETFSDYNEAAKGYARCNNKEQVEICLQAGANRESLLSGYAFHGHVREVNELAATGADLSSAITSYFQQKYLRKEKYFQIIALTESSELRKLILEKTKFKFLDHMDCMQAFSLYELVYPDTKKNNLQYTEKNFAQVLTLLSDKNSADHYTISTTARRGELFRTIMTLPKDTRDIMLHNCLDESSALGKRFHKKDLAAIYTRDLKFRKMILAELNIADPNPTPSFSLNLYNGFGGFLSFKKAEKITLINNEEKDNSFHPL